MAGDGGVRGGAACEGGVGVTARGAHVVATCDGLGLFVRVQHTASLDCMHHMQTSTALSSPPYL